jgi:hypothetical protein
MFFLNEGGAEETERLQCKSPDQKLTESALLSGNIKFSSQNTGFVKEKK